MHRFESFDDRYRIVQELGSGSQGSVFLALYVPTEEFRAVKRIHTGEDAGFCREPEMMKQLRCGHLPRVIDVIREGQDIWLVMEHVRGTGMDRILSGGRTVCAEQTEDAARQITDALCYLESRDPPVCHLDIKPSNLIRRPDGCIKLVDFGAAWKEKTDRPVMGTDGYAAPEQYTRAKRVDIRTDIYGLGAVLYRMLTGKTYSEVMHASQIPNCPAELARIITKCLEKDPEQRFQSAEQLKRALAGYRNRERRRSLRVRVLGALAIALPAAAFVTSALPASMNLRNEREWNYESLLDEAELLSGSQSRACYRKAVFLDPGRSEAYLQYLDEAQADGIFSAKEALFLRDLLHTVELGMDVTNEEVLAEDPDSYGQTALRIGLLYWYCCGEEDGKRAARAWFGKAADAGEHLAEPEDRGWLETARLYRRLAQTEELAGAQMAGKQDPENAAAYWNILGDLMTQTDRLDSPVMRLEFCRDALSQLAFLCSDLELAGIGMKAQEERILELLTKAREVTGPPELKKMLKMLEEQTEEAAGLALAAAEDRKREERIREETE